MEKKIYDKYRALVVEEHALLRAGLWALLVQNRDVEVVGEAADVNEAIELVGVLRPDLVLMDISMSGENAVASIAELRGRHPGLKVLVLGMDSSDRVIQKSQAAGVDGYLLKGATEGELHLAVRTVLKGGCYRLPDNPWPVVNVHPDGVKATDTVQSWEKLTKRERQVLGLIAEGHPNKFIARYLCLSVKTVEKHRSNLMGKLDIHNASSLTGFAIEKGLRSSYARQDALPIHSRGF